MALFFVGLGLTMAAILRGACLLHPQLRLSCCALLERRVCWLSSTRLCVADMEVDVYSRKITSCESRVTSSSLASIKVVTTSLRVAKESLASVTAIRKEVRLASRQDEKDKLTRKYVGPLSYSLRPCCSLRASVAATVSSLSDLLTFTLCSSTITTVPKLFAAGSCVSPSLGQVPIPPP